VKYIILGIVRTSHNLMYLYYLDEGNACVNWVEYYIVNVSIRYSIDEVDAIK
jgi:hypothetical protein